MRKFFLASFVLTAVLAVAATGFALERVHTPVADPSTDHNWSSVGTCAIIYYNRCTGWSYAWGGWGPCDRIGVCADACCPYGTVQQTQLRVFTASPPGYGFTGTVSIRAADANCCPTGSPLAQHPWLATGAGGGLYDIDNWNVTVPARFTVVYQWGPNGAGPGRFGTDHPAIGPTGPAACGFCYPTTRVNHSYYWGGVPGCAGASPEFCPGIIFSDGNPVDLPCSAQLRLDIFMTCACCAIDPQNWSHVKNLYR